jgi:hypothetical protein
MAMTEEREPPQYEYAKRAPLAEQEQSAGVSAIIARAKERGEPIQSYDPHELLLDIVAILRSKGLNPDKFGRETLATQAAFQLLRAFDIVPAGDHRYIDRVNAPDPDMR